MIAQLTETENMLANALVSVVRQVGQYVPSNEQQGSCSDQAACWFALVDRCLSIDMRADLEKNAPAPQGHEEAAQKELEAQIERLRELAKKKLVKEKVAVMRANQNQQRRQHVQSSMNDFETAIESASSEETLSMMLKTILTSVGEAMAHIYELFPPTREEQEEKNDSNNSHHPQQKMLKEILDDFFITLHGHTKWWVSNMLSRLVDVTALTGDELLTHGRYVDVVRRAMATALSVSLNHLSSEAVLRIVDDSVPLVLTPMYFGPVGRIPRRGGTSSHVGHDGVQGGSVDGTLARRKSRQARRPKNKRENGKIHSAKPRGAPLSRPHTLYGHDSRSG